ncbi:hypothetical protein, partial [Evtepia gabavorous]|uniref:hypothetical protein n=1 Tax=Evtepia gabavorous TaxID=2211183 RepID=UPI003A930AC3
LQSPFPGERILKVSSGDMRLYSTALFRIAWRKKNCNPRGLQNPCLKNEGLLCKIEKLKEKARLSEGF